MAKTSSFKQYLHIIIAVVIFIVVRLILPINPDGGLTPSGANALALFIAMIYIWLTYGTGWVSFMVIALVPLTGVCNTGTALQLSFGNAIVVMLIAMLILSYALNQLGVTRHIATWFITRKIVYRRPYVFLFFFLLANLVIGAVIDMVPTQVVFFMLAKSILDDLGYKKEDKFAKALYLGSLWMTAVACTSTPLGHTVILIILGLAENMIGPVSFFKYMMVGIPFAIISLFLILVIIRFIIRPDCTKFDNYDVEAKRAEMKPLSTQGKIAAVVYILVIIAWLFPDVFSGVVPAASGYVKALTTAVPPMLAVGALALIRIEGKPCLDYDVAVRSIPWSTAIFIAAIMMFSQLLSLDTTGINPFLKGLLMPITQTISPGMVVILVLFIILVLTNFASNIVAGVLAMTAIVPAFLSMGDVGFPLLAYAALVAMICNMAFMTAAGSGTVAVALQDGYLTPKEIFKNGIIPALGFYLIAVLIIWPLAKVVFAG